MTNNAYPTLLLLALTACGADSTAEAGADAGAGPVDANDANDANPATECPGIGITVSGRLDVDVQLVEVSGSVTLNGAPITATSSPVQLIFQRTTDPKSSAQVSVAADGRYRVSLVPGNYDVAYGATLAACRGGFPCNSGTVASADLSVSGNFDVDIPTITVHGAVTLNATQVNLGENNIRFAATEPHHGSVTAAITSENDRSTYAVTLLPGTYDLWWALNPRWTTACLDSVTTLLPCNDGKLKTATLTTSGALDVDVKSVRVQGTVSLNGNKASLFGFAIGLRSSDAAASNTYAKIHDDGSNYSVSLVPGSYDTWWQFVNVLQSSCTDSTTTEIPCNEGKLGNADLSTNGNYDVDVASIRVSGNVTINDTSPALRGQHIVFTGTSDDRDDARARIVDGAGDGTGDHKASYSISLLSGTYDVWWSLDALTRQPCRDSTTTVVPCNDGVIAHAALTTSGLLDLAVRSVRVQGRVLLNGQSHPVSGSVVSFVGTSDDLGDSRATVVPQKLASEYSVSLLAGDYDIWWRPDTATGNACALGQTGGVPCNPGRVDQVSLTTDGALDIDIPSLQLSGDVTLDSAQFPTAGRDRGWLRFYGTDATTGSVQTLALGTTGQASYSVTLLPGSYAVLYAANSQLCSDGDGSPVPCTDAWVAGCD